MEIIGNMNSFSIFFWSIFVNYNIKFFLEYSGNLSIRHINPNIVYKKLLFLWFKLKIEIDLKFYV